MRKFDTRQSEGEGNVTTGDTRRRKLDMMGFRNIHGHT